MTSLFSSMRLLRSSGVPPLRARLFEQSSERTTGCSRASCHTKSFSTTSSAKYQRSTPRSTVSPSTLPPSRGVQGNSALKPPLTKHTTLYDSDLDATIVIHPDTVSIVSPSNCIHRPFHFDHVWLRDACTEQGASLQLGSGQKVFHTSDVPIPQYGFGLLDANATPRLVDAPNGRSLELTFEMSHGVLNAFSATFAAPAAPPILPNTPHISRIPIALLLDHASPQRYAASHFDIGAVASSWEGADLTAFPSSSPPLSSSEVKSSRFDQQAATSRPARVDWTTLNPHNAVNDFAVDQVNAHRALAEALMRDGLAFVTGLPIDTTGSQPRADGDSCSLARLAETLGEIRHTFYGPLWDVRSLGSGSRNIAYTNVDLGFHMDLCYFQNPPRFQFLHMLKCKVRGGESIFVDAYKVAEYMWQHHRELWQVLAEVPVGFHYNNDGYHYRYTHPTFEVAGPTSGHWGPAESTDAERMPRLIAVNYSPPFQSPLPLTTPRMQSPAERRKFYEALKTFADLTHDPKFKYERMLGDGECVIFDNRRVLHSRKGFEWDEKEEEEGGQVKRWLKGCYVDGDAIWSKYRVLVAQAGASARSAASTQ
ncbi:related to cox10-farnesyl transferase [Ceraceosorus bombacis]|uniref:Related to cox10-farnesyl transferase n=1 Tax=Ceraceosorus bombacis TaxID=401625 RepID=A0A0P1B9R6_9BASI|nr:related to cox10-farnesyl transferase [Ceraceosorus bombacis]